MHEKQDGSFATVVTAGDQGTQTVYFEVFMANDSEHAPDRVKFEGWRVTVAPDGDRDISIRLNPTPDCEASGAICTPEGGALESGLTRSVRGPTKVSVADAQVEEADGAMLEFEVSLSRTLDEAFTVAYATSDGSARSGEDYRDSAGALTFAPGTTRQSISVPVIDDTHDEGSETLQLTLSNPNPSRVKLARATATGTINNSDPMPRAWAVRLGRTISSQVVDGLGSPRVRPACWSSALPAPFRASLRPRSDAFHQRHRGMRYDAGPLSIEGRVRALVSHEASNYDEWGASAALRVTPRSSGRGLTLTIAPQWGESASAAGRLWSSNPTATSTGLATLEPTGRVEVETGYGFGLGSPRGVVTPYTGMTLGNDASRAMRAGARWELGQDVHVGLEASRRTHGDEGTEVWARTRLRF